MLIETFRSQRDSNLGHQFEGKRTIRYATPVSYGGTLR